MSLPTNLRKSWLKISTLTIILLLTIFLAACGDSTATPVPLSLTTTQVATTYVTTTLASTSPAQSTTSPSVPNDQLVSQFKANVDKASRPASTWDGPVSGPKAQTGKFIVYVSSNQQNGGVQGVGNGVEEAARVIGWKFLIIDGVGTVPGQTDAMNQAINLKPDGIILGGLDASSQKALVQKAQDLGIKIVGWHAGAASGPIPELNVFTNVTSDPEQTAQLAADYAIARSNGTAQVTILTDSHYSIAVAKATAMRKEIEKCNTCKVLSYEDTSLAEVSTGMPQLITSLQQRFGKDLTWILGINDLYFDFGAPSLKAVGVGPSGPPQFVSAGDGSVSAYNRIRKGEFQAATIPEPLNLQGWQLVDELNRAFAGVVPSGYVTPVHLVTNDNITVDGGPQNVYDPGNGYREQYKKIWGK